MNPDPEVPQLLAGRRKKSFGWREILLVLLCFGAGFGALASGVPDRFPLSEEESREAWAVLSGIDSTISFECPTQSPFALFQYGSLQMMVVSDGLIGGYLEEDHRTLFFRQAGFSLLLAAQAYLNAGKEDSARISLEGVRMLTWEAKIATTVSKVPEILGIKYWQKLSKAIGKYLEENLPANWADESGLREKLVDEINQTLTQSDRGRSYQLLLVGPLAGYKSHGWTKRSWQTRELVELIALGMMQDGESTIAAEFLGQAIELFRNTGFPLLALEYKIHQINAYKFSGEVEKQVLAMEDYMAICQSFPHTSVWQLFAKTSLAESYYNLGGYAEARDISNDIKRSLPEMEPYYWQISYQATAVAKLGYINQEQGNLRDAIFYAQTACQLLEQGKPTSNNPSSFQHDLLHASYLDLLAQLYYYSGRMDLSIRTFEDSRIQQQSASQKLSDLEMGTAEKLLSRILLDGSIENVLNTASEISEINKRLVLGTDWLGPENIAEIHQLLRNANIPKESDMMIRGWISLASIALESGYNEDSTAYFISTAEEQIENSGFSEYQENVRLLKGRLFLDQGKEQEGLALLSNIYAVKESRSSYSAAIEIGRYMIKQGRMENACSWIIDSLKLEETKFDLALHLTGVRRRGICLSYLGQNEAAKNTYLDGWNYFLASTKNQLGGYSSDGWSTIIWPLAEGICSYYIQTNQPDSAFYWQEKVRTDFLNYLTIRQNASNQEKDLITASIEADLQLLEKQIIRDGESPATRVRKAEILTRLEAARVSEYPEYQPPVSMDSLQQLLRPEELLLEYAIVGDSVWLFLLDQHSLKARVLGPTSAIEKGISKWNTYLRAIQDPAPGLNLMAEESLNQLHSLLIDPIKDSILNGARRLIIVPDGNLYDVPFAALTSDQGIGGREGIEWLCRSHEICLLPAANWLTKRTQLSSSTYEEILLMAHSGKGHVRDVPAAELGPIRSISGELAFVEEEIKSIEGVYEGGDMLIKTGEDLTETWFMREAELGNLKHYDLIHFAGHMTIDPVFPSLSALLVEPDQAHYSDGRISTFDFSEIELHAKMVVLSGCHSSGGRPLNGAGRLGFMQALAGTGAKNLVLSQWNVNDYQTSRLFAEFYTQLSNGSDPAAALQQAQISLADKEASYQPYLWAAFQMFGVPE